MPVKFGGQNYQSQCPVCHASIKWRRSINDANARIRAVAGQHYAGCPALTIDPEQLLRAARQQ
jgi:hypothetical protein